MSEYTDLARRTEKLEEDVEALKNKNTEFVIQTTTLCIDVKYIKDTVDVVIKEVKKLTDQPAKRWDNLINTLLNAFVSLLITSGGILYVLTKH